MKYNYENVLAIMEEGVERNNLFTRVLNTDDITNVMCGEPSDLKIVKARIATFSFNLNNDNFTITVYLDGDNNVFFESNVGFNTQNNLYDMNWVYNEGKRKLSNMFTDIQLASQLLSAFFKTFNATNITYDLIGD